MTALRQSILDYLNQFKRPVPRRLLHKHLLSLGFVLSDSKMRGEVQAMVESGELIGSTHHKQYPGYFIINNLDQAAIAAAERRTKAHTELKIANTIEDSAAKKFGGQGKLFQIVEAFK